MPLSDTEFVNHGYSENIANWSLDTDIIYLNHGSFGACPKCILEKQTQFRTMMERDPLNFFIRELEGLIEHSRNELAKFIDADAEDLVFVPNVSYGVNTVLKSLDFKAGDEIITTDHEYFSCANALDTVASKTGCTIIEAKLPFPVNNPDQLAESILQCITPRTRLILIDHVTSKTGIVLPIEDIVSKMSSLGIDTLIDGAHAPGMLPLDIKKINPSYYTGNCHKWLCSPRGAAFLWVRKDRQLLIHPLVTTYLPGEYKINRSNFQFEFIWSGTSDLSAILCIPESINFFSSLCPDGLERLRYNNRLLALKARNILCEALNVEPPVPESMMAFMASIPIPDRERGKICPFSFIDPDQTLLYEKYKISVPILSFPDPPKRLIRISAHVYNTLAQYEFLADALREIFKL